MVVSKEDKKIIAELVGSKFKRNIIEKKFSEITKDKIVIKPYVFSGKKEYYVYPEYSFYIKHSFSIFKVDKNNVIKKIDWYGECE